MRSSFFIKLFLTVFILIILVRLAPHLGLGDQVLGVTRAQALFSLWTLLVISSLFQFLSIDVSPANGESRLHAILRSIRLSASSASQYLFRSDKFHTTRSESMQAAIVASFFAMMFPILLYKSIASIEGQLDFHYYQALLDFDIDWRTPMLSFAGNLLYNFGIQVPVNGNLAPMIAIARILSPTYHLVIALTFFSAAFGTLFWSVGGTIGLRAVPRMIFAGLVALIVTIPNGLDKIILVVPPYFLTHLLMCGLWWGEAAVLCLTAVYLFFLLGQHASALVNTLLGVGFSILCFVVLLAFSAGAFFVVPIIFFYCAAFLVTSRSKELAWKVIVSGILAATMLLTHIPVYFQDLYSYTYGAYFADLLWKENVDFLTLVGASTMASALNYDFRVPLFMLVSVATLCVCFVQCRGVLKRIAGVVLFSEGCIILLGCLNAITFKYPIGLLYSEVVHEAFLAAFFILCLMFVLAAMYNRLDTIIIKAGAHIKEHGLVRWLAANRLRLLLSGAFIGGLSQAIAMPSATSFHMYPAKEPQSVQILKSQLALKPGEAFPGRLLVLGGMLGAPGSQWPGGQGSIIDVLESRYKVSLGNDHYVNLPVFGISIANEFAHWTSPVTFIFLRTFFGRTDDIVNNKSFFPLRKFNARIARLFGIRMVVSDAPNLPGSTLVYESKGGTADLRIFRIDDVNLGQYSPTRLMKVSTAVEALAALESASFDPKHDVVVEKELPNDLVTSDQVSIITALGSALSIHAESSGHSLLVLPFEYSHCMRLEVTDGKSALLIPVNLQQTGILFEKYLSAKISYRFGLFDQPQCRHQDLERADRLRLRDALK